MNATTYLTAFVVGAAAGAWFGFDANGALGALGGGVTGGVLAAVAVALGLPQVLADAPDSDGDGIPDLLDSNDRNRW